MLLLFVHGWSVTSTSTYGQLPKILAKNAINHNLNIEIKDIWLGKYISFHDEVTMTDLIRALEQALHDVVPEVFRNSVPFSCITHSTGGPVMREWIDRYYGSENLDKLPLKHLIMLAPANHGSSLATLGKERIGRIKSWFQGIEPGVRILDWLALGSHAQEQLAIQNLSYQNVQNGYYPFVIIGQSIDKKYYDFINTYLTEVGSDGVVRVSGANMNYAMVTLREKIDNKDHVKHHFDEIPVNMLELDGNIQTPAKMPLAVIPKASHSGSKMGVMKSPTLRNATKKPVVDLIFQCLKVDSMTLYNDLMIKMEQITSTTQSKDSHSKKHRYSMLAFSVLDDEGEAVKDFDLFLLYGNDFQPHNLPKGFLVDKQKNTKTPNNIVFYVDYDKIANKPEAKLGLRIIARPNKGFSYYHPVEFRGDTAGIITALEPNETLYVKIILHRHVDENSFGSIWNTVGNQISIFQK